MSDTAVAIPRTECPTEKRPQNEQSATNHADATDQNVKGTAKGARKNNKNKKKKGSSGNTESSPFVPTGGGKVAKRKEVLFGDTFADGFHVPQRLRDKSNDLISTANDWHFAMLNDHPRNEHYRDALREVIVPGETVCLEVGAGSGLLSCIAAGLGAKQIVAIEANKHLVKLAREIIKANGYTEQVTVLHGMSDTLSLKDTGLSEPADVLLSELLGTMLLSESALSYVADARDRLCKKSAKVVPSRGEQCAQLIMSEDLQSLTCAREWGGVNLSPFNTLIDTSSLLCSKAFGFRLSTLKHEFLSPDVRVMEVDFEKDTPKKGTVQTFTVVPTQDGVVHAVMASWKAHSPGAAPISTHPSDTVNNLPRDMHWGQGLQLVEDYSEEGAMPHPFKVTKGSPVRMIVSWSENCVLMQIRLEHIKTDDAVHDAQPAAQS
eukprot:Rhum_TRINITY_DN21393_c0_g1::Rhum_TRINITY_DN21393_c0_g1_i1::g.173813::m.173813/K11438/PRMT7; type III protein arginine methyltransferase